MARPLELLSTSAVVTANAHLGRSVSPGASITVVAEDQAYFYGYGVKSVGGTQPVSSSTCFTIGSCSKAFVSATMAALVADGLTVWDDPIRKYVPEFSLYDPVLADQVTLRDLSANRLGLPRRGLVEYGFDARFSAEDVLERLRFTPPCSPFRSAFTYVNMAHVANAVAIGRITGKGFLPTVRELILEPLGMSATSGGARVREELPDRAGWHVAAEGKPLAIEPIYMDNYLGGGGMCMSADDAAQWLRLHLNGGLVDGRQIISREALIETHRPHTIAHPGKEIASLFHPGGHLAAYALGWSVTDLDGHKLITHSGSEPGAVALTMLFPDLGIGLLVCCNSFDRSILPLAYALAADLLGLAPRDWAAQFARLEMKQRVPVTTLDDLHRYAGRYHHAGDGVVEIQFTDGRLSGTFLDGYRMAFSLAPLNDTQFEATFLDPCWKGETGDWQPVFTFKIEDGHAVAVAYAGMEADDKPGFERWHERQSDRC